jgi:hypothetical protein
MLPPQPPGMGLRKYPLTFLIEPSSCPGLSNERTRTCTRTRLETCNDGEIPPALRSLWYTYRVVSTGQFAGSMRFPGVGCGAELTSYPPYLPNLSPSPFIIRIGGWAFYIYFLFYFHFRFFLLGLERRVIRGEFGVLLVFFFFFLGGGSCCHGVCRQLRLLFLFFY